MEHLCGRHKVMPTATLALRVVLFLVLLPKISTKKGVSKYMSYPITRLVSSLAGLYLQVKRLLLYLILRAITLRLLRVTWLIF